MALQPPKLPSLEPDFGAIRAAEGSHHRDDVNQNDATPTRALLIGARSVMHRAPQHCRRLAL